ncbi:MmcQ/YjbR family DNA-binding protein [Cohnella herbarum]|uniref:MmcQ/YjbR family DNA-binding protein n=1 Tax=Cohnella herbarum TaxID=2728023 RepID=A0A7Z2ZKC7_9BACL|nr:MmcQ/YjbR family DNA-binding protein [Cohnella herbarum]QJD82639.1 MmcQ/YjbR family DNA-binding protein [Cohnella herbarum]
MADTDKLGVDSPFHQDLLRRIRQLCLSFPNVSERLSHGAPTFFYKEKKSFVQYHDNHHGDGRIALWCAADSDVQTILVQSNPDVYFLPAYVAHLGWIGIRLDRDARWEEIESIIGDAYINRAKPKRK